MSGVPRGWFSIRNCTLIGSILELEFQELVTKCLNFWVGVLGAPSV